MSLWNRIKKNIFFWRQARSWQSIERFDPTWKKRIATMSQFIPQDTTSLVDLGCGPRWLREIITPSINYLGVDYKTRGQDTLICDFNKHQYPQKPIDVAFVSGCLEYVLDYDWFIQNICKYSKTCILSYCTLDSYPDIALREKQAWVNHLSEHDIKRIFEKYEFHLVHLELTDNRIFVFEKKNIFESTAY